MPNHALTEANSLAARITELEEKIKGLKTEPVDPKKKAKFAETQKEYAKAKENLDRLSAKLQAQNHDICLEEGQKGRALAAVGGNLQKQQSILRTLLSTALEAAKG